MPIAHSPLVKLISTKVDDQVPAVVRDDHPAFVTFLRKYYQWLEQEGNAYEIIGNLIAYGDIDQTTTNFIEYFEKTYTESIPDGVLIDKDFLIKHIREWYRERGSRKSFQYLFRILFDDDIDFRLPSEEILRPSDGRWSQAQTIKTTYTAGVESLQGRSIIGLTSNAKAILESVLNTAENSGNMAEIIISSVDGTFQAGETIRGVDVDGNNVDFVLFEMYVGNTITNPGNGYSVGGPIIFNPPSAGSTTISAQVAELTNGFIDTATLVSGGSGFFLEEYLSIDNTGHLDPVEGKAAKIRVKKIIAQAEDLVPNGNFPTDISSWTDASIGAATVTWNAGAYLDLNDTDDGGTIAHAYQQQSGLDIGVEHVITFDTLTNAGAILRVGITAGSTEFLEVFNLPIGTNQSFVFTPTVANPFISFLLNETGGGSITTGIDNVRISRNDKNYVLNGDLLTDLTNWTANDSGTGSSSWNEGGYIELNGGSSGTGARHQTLTLVSGRKYRLKLDVLKNTGIIRIGTSIGVGDIFEDTSAPPVADREIVFTAGATNILWFGNTVNTPIGIDNISVIASGTISELEIENKGGGYVSLPTLDGTGEISGTGSNVTLFGMGIGGIKKITIIKPGFGVTAVPTIDMSGFGDGTATITALTDVVFVDSEGRWLTSDSLLDTNRVLQDSDFYQQYSYVIKSSTTFSLWEDIVKKLLHPAGTKMFGQISTSQTVAAPLVQFVMAVSQELELELFPDGELTAELDLTIAIALSLISIPAYWETDSILLQQTLSSNWNHWEYMKSASPGFSVLAWGTQTAASWNAGHFSTISTDFIDANRYAVSKYSAAPEVQELVFEEFEAVGSPNTTFWNSVAATGARSAEQSIVGTQSFKFTGTQTMRSELANGDKCKLAFWFYASSTGTDGTTDITRLASIHENVSSDGASVFIVNSGGNRYLGAASGITTSANDFQITQDTWYYIEFSVDGGAGTFELKVNRNTKKTGLVTGVTAIDRIEIGHNSNQSANFISYIDQSRTYLKY